MTVNKGYLLVFHGSRDPRAQKGMEGLSGRLLKMLKTIGFTSRSSRGGSLLLCPPSLLEVACLELAEVSLAERLCQLGSEATSQGITKIKVLPMLLATGVHVQKDIPREVAIAQTKLGNQLELNIHLHLGSYEGIVELISLQYQNVPQEGRIIVAHGSSLSDANQEVERLANKVGAIAAYTFVSPDLKTQVETLIASGKRIISIVPHVLFPGKITDLIATQVQELQQKYPNVNFWVGQPLGQLPGLAQIILTAIEAA